MAKLVCQSGPSAGHEYPLNKDVLSMGRQSTCDVQIMDHMSSRQHCQVRRDGKLFTLVDLGSRNGTHLNGKKVSERQLAFGDHIRVGECEWVLVKESGDVELKDLLTKYEIQDKLGEGGMGVVYKANQKSMARVVALKILSPKYASRQRFVDQFIREARAAGQLNHPNIIQVHDVATENDIHYFSMEYVDGPTCMQLLRANGAFPVPEALEIARQVAKALEYAHDHRLIHQDIKPDNIMIGANNTVKLADLGISKTFDEAEQDDGPKRVMGTPHYMAPEQALGSKDVDHRVDLYALAVVIFECLTGTLPFEADSELRLIQMQAHSPPPDLLDRAPWIAKPIAAVMKRALAKLPDERFSSGAQLLAALEAAYAQAAAAPPVPVAKAAEPVPPPLQPRVKPSRAPWLALAVVVLGAIGLAVTRPWEPAVAPPPVDPPVLAAVADAGAPEPALVAAVPLEDAGAEVFEALDAGEEDAGVTLDAGRRAVSKAPAKKGRLNVLTTHNGEPYWAQVVIDGVSKGRTPLLLELPAGRYQVRVERPGFKTQQREIRVASGKAAVVRIDLTQ